jgi:hypothetical protein
MGSYLGVYPECFENEQMASGHTIFRGKVGHDFLPMLPDPWQLSGELAGG